MKLENPDTFFLGDIYWQLFGGLTFRQSVLSERIRLCMWFAFFRQIAAYNKMHKNDVLWVLRLERGDQSGRLHFHFIISGLPQQNIKISDRFAMRALWKRLGGGISKIDLYDSRLHGLPYMAGALGCPASDIGSTGAMAYESAKFGSANSVLMLSKSVLKVIQANNRRDASTLAMSRTDRNM